jgi:hypothetical protein
MQQLSRWLVRVSRAKEQVSTFFFLRKTFNFSLEEKTPQFSIIFVWWQVSSTCSLNSPNYDDEDDDIRKESSRKYHVPD